MTFTLEQVFAGKGFADVPASPVQLAVCRASEGDAVDADLLDDDAIARHFGCGRARLGLVAPVLLVIIAGVRGGKSFLAACGATRDIFAADCSRLKAHEVARHPIIAPTVDNAHATFTILCGIWEGSAVLAPLIVGKTDETLTVRRPDGRVFEIVVVAAHRGAVTLRSRWLAGFTFEEVAGFGVESMGAAVNAEELLRAAQTRLLAGTQGRLISSPFGQQGLLWRLYQTHFGKPGRVLVVHASTRALNPSFSQDTIDEVRARDPDGAAREFDAAWVDAETAYFESSLLVAARRDTPLEVPPRSGVRFVAAWDAATRGNGWSLVVAAIVAGRIVVALAREWRGSKTAPLSPKVVIVEIATVLRRYGVTRVHVDQWSVDALRDTARDAGLELIECPTAARDEGYKALATHLANRTIELPPHDMLHQDLRGVRKRITPTGVRIELARTPDGRHCDYAPSVALSISALVTSAQNAAASARFAARRQAVNRTMADHGYAGPQSPDEVRAILRDAREGVTKHPEVSAARINNWLRNR